MNGFEASEIKGRHILAGIFKCIPFYKSFSVENLQFSEGKYTRYDGGFFNGKKDSVFELKFRSNSIDRYPDYLMAKSKWDELVRHHMQGKQAYYIMVFNEPDGSYSCLIFDISIRIKLWGVYAKGHTEDSIQPNSTVDTSRGRAVKEVIWLEQMDYDIRIDGYTNSTEPIPFDEDSADTTNIYGINP